MKMRIETLLVLVLVFNVAGCQQSSTGTESSPEAENPSLFSASWPYGSPSSFSERMALIDNATLHDGISRKEAEAILGPPTSERNGMLDWYHNPEHRWHVAAYFRAELRDGDLYNWSTGNR